MNDAFLRTQMLLGCEAMEKLWQSRVAVFGIGGVGGHAVEALVRAGIGEIDIIDHDEVAVSNLNRQLVATTPLIGHLKVEAMADRIHEISPQCQVHVHPCFYLPDENEAHFAWEQYDYIVDAIDTVKGKIGLILAAHRAKVPIICSMGAGNKLNPTMFEVADIYETAVDPLAKVMRKECKKAGIRRLKVVYSKELPMSPSQNEITETKGNTGRIPPGSISFVPSVVGLIMASEVVKDITGIRNDRMGI